METLQHYPAPLSIQGSEMKKCPLCSSDLDKEDADGDHEKPDFYEYYECSYCDYYWSAAPHGR